MQEEIDYITYIKNNFTETEKLKTAFLRVLIDGILRGRIKNVNDLNEADFELLRAFSRGDVLGKQTIRRIANSNATRISQAHPTVWTRIISIIKKFEDALGIRLRKSYSPISTVGTPQSTGLPPSLYTNPPWSPSYRPTSPPNKPKAPPPNKPKAPPPNKPKAPPPNNKSSSLGGDSNEWARSDFDDPDGLSSIYSTLGRMSFGGKGNGFDEEELPLPDEDQKPSTPNQKPSQKPKEPQGKTNPPMDEDESPSDPYEEDPYEEDPYEEDPYEGEPPEGGESESQPPPPIGAQKWIEAKASQLPARASWLFGVDPNLGADRHLIPTQQGAEPDTLPDAAHHPWEDPFSGWRMPGGFDRFTQQSRPMGPGDLSGMPDEEHASFGAYVAGVRAGERILTYDFGGGLEASQKEAAVRGMTRNPRMNTSGVKQRADGSIAKWNPKLPDDL